MRSCRPDWGAGSMRRLQRRSASLSCGVAITRVSCIHSRSTKQRWSPFWTSNPRRTRATEHGSLRGSEHNHVETAGETDIVPRSMPRCRALWGLLLMILTLGSVRADTAADVEHLLTRIRQDQSVPSLDSLHRVKSINPGCAAFEGQYRDIAIQVETHPDSQRVASLLLQIPGSDQVHALLPVVSRVLGAPHREDRQPPAYRWNWPDDRAASLHAAPGGAGMPGLTVVSLFYR